MALVSVRELSPLDGLLQLQAGLERLFRNPSVAPSFSFAGSNVYPLLNVFTDRDGGFVVRAEIAGVKPEDVELTVERGRLTIAGERPGEAPAGDGSYHRRERSHGKFSRTIQLPDDLDPTAATAEYRNGLLTVRLPKRAEAKPRQIRIATS
jgi:HSP20 family protein